jgi:hypothetical protein
LIYITRETGGLFLPPLTKDLSPTFPYKDVCDNQIM